MQIKNNWFKDKTHSLEDEAGVIAINVWKIAMNSILNLENADYQTKSNKQRLEIVAEILIFLIHVIDRITIKQFDEEARRVFITELATQSARHWAENYSELYGSGEYQQEFLDLLNARIHEYTDFDYDEETGPGFGMKRYFGGFMRERLGEKNNKWVPEQMIEIEVPEMLRILKRVLKNLT